MTETSTVRPGLGAPPADDILLDVRNLRTYFKVMDGVVPAVDDVSFSLGRGQTLGIVGESGSGKSVTALTIMRLLDIPPAEIGAGSEIWFDGQEILSLPEGEMRQIRGNEMAMIFQEPLTSLNPVFTVGDQIAEQVKLHMKVTARSPGTGRSRCSASSASRAPSGAPSSTRTSCPAACASASMIGMALSCEPKLLIADEPTTALDVTVQAQILELLKAIQERTGAALMLITHDLGVVAEMVDNVIVMYAGQVVEQGTVDEVLIEPRMPYTMGLIESIPTRGEARRPAVGDPGRRPVAVPPAARAAGSSPAARTAGRRAARCRPSCTRPARAAASPAATSTSPRRPRAVTPRSPSTSRTCAWAAG